MSTYNIRTILPRVTLLFIAVFFIGVSIHLHAQTAPGGRADIVVIEGDSLSNGSVGLPTDPRRPGDWVNYISQYITWYSSASIFNIAAAGEQVKQMLTEYPTEARPHKPAADKKAYYIIYGGINDIQGSGVGGPARTAEETYTDLKTLWAMAHADGFTVVAFTIHPFYPFSNPPQSEADAIDLKRRTLNTLILSDTSKYDILVRLDQVFPGTMPSATDPDFADRLHTNEQGAKKIALAIATALQASTTTTTTGGTVTTGTTVGTTGTVGGTTATFATVGAPPLTCNERYTSSVVPPAGYGAAFNIFNTTHELLLRFNCDSVGNATFSVNSDDASDQKYVYKTGFRWNGAAWVPITFTGTSAPDSGGNWLLMGASARINNTDLRPANVFTFFAAYSCTFSGGAWKCGCRDAMCIFNGWQIQAIRNPIGSDIFFGGGGTSGATTGGTVGGTVGGTTAGTTGGTGGGSEWTGGVFTPPTWYGIVKANAAKICYSMTGAQTLSPATRVINQSGTAANPLVFVPGGTFSGGTLTINGDYVVIKGFTFVGVTLQVNGNNVRVTGNNFLSAPGEKIIDTASDARNIRIDRNILDAGTSDTKEDIQINIADGTSNPYYHRIDHNFFRGGVTNPQTSSGGINVYLGLVNKQRESISRSLIEKNYVDSSDKRQYGFYLKSTENVIENNVVAGTENRTGVRHGQRNVFFNNRFENVGAFSFDTDNFFVSNVFQGSIQGFWAGSGDCTFSLGDCLPDEVPPGANHANAVRTKIWGNVFTTASDKLRIGYLEFNPRREPTRCPEGIDLNGNSDAAVGAEGCSVPATQNVNPAATAPTLNLGPGNVGPNGDADDLCP